MIKIIADSTCDLSDDILKKYDIAMVPLTINIEGRDYLDRIDIMPEDFYKMLATLDELPKTGLSSPALFIKAFEDAVSEGISEILCICMSSGTSGSYQAAEVAKSTFCENHDDVRIYVVDSKCMSHGSGYLILKSAILREHGADFDELIDFNETYKTNVKHLLSVDDLDNLIKSGRLTNVSAMIGKILKVKPIMSMHGGKGAIVAKVRGRKKVFNHYIDEFKARMDAELTEFVIIGYTSDEAVAENLKLKLQNETDFKGDIYIMQMGVAVGTHVGLGGFSMYFMEKGHRHDGLIYNEMAMLLKKKDEFLAMLRRFRAEKK